MDYMQLFDSKKTGVLLAGLLLLGGCKSSEKVQEAMEAQAQQRTTTPNTEAAESNELITGNTQNSEPVLVTYRNKSSNIQITLNPDEDEFYLDLSGIAPSDKDSVVVVDSSLVKNRARDIQSLLSSYRKAQDLFYLGEYRDALAEVDKTLGIQETADAYALKGTIFFMLENPTAARANWNRAVQLDPNIPVPSIPELETLINEIREDGDQ